ncbi:MAG TPA: histidinol-phosphate transaminase [Actinomycetota bacterium]|nr:histidinol-phosphate transaminase [Actinomycetota bacterium]
MLPRPRPELADLEPYSTSGTASGKILLHANENPYPLPSDVMDEVLEATSKLELNRYPPAAPTELIAEIATYAGVDPSWVWPGDGSNEVLLQASLAYGGPGRTALLFDPTYVMHMRQAKMAGTSVETIRRESDFSISLDAAVHAIERHTPDVVFVCTPNNPTGTVTPIGDIRSIADAASGLVIVDEAYHEFSGATFVPYLEQHPNVIVSRTLSKAFRLAGLRLGYGIAAPELLEEMGRVRMPYGLSSFTQLAATIVLRHREKVLEVVSSIAAERDRIATTLAGLDGVDVFDGAANFVFFRHARAAEFVAALAKHGIVIRDFSFLEGCEDCLRVTAGTPEENDAFLSVAASLS